MTSPSSLILNPETIRKFYDLDGRYVYVIKGLPTVDLVSPCKRGWHRWVRHEPDGDEGGCPGGDTPLASEVSSVLIRKITADLDKRDEATRRSIRALDIWNGQCSNSEGSATAGARLSLGGSSGCWTHAHPSEYGVYDASWWVLEHPGNRFEYLRFQTNPIAAIAEELGAGTRSSSSSAEERVTLTLPAWHPPGRFNSMKWRPSFLGLYGDVVDFAGLPWETRGPGMARFLGATSVSSGRDASAFELCGSPGEVANDPQMGHRYNLFGSVDQGLVKPTELDQEHPAGESKSMVWTSIAFEAQDQLRQRIAWALSQIFIVSSVSLSGLSRATEIWAAYYDIFVNNAFGMFGDILKQVSFSPMMGSYLTYLSSKSFAHSFELHGEGYFPDENYAREVLQLFSIGLTMLHENGTEILDGDGSPVPTYTNKDVVTFARGWTGFEKQKFRSNLEPVGALKTNNHNFIDPMKISSRQGRDVFPKLGLDFHDGEGRRYIGDGVQRCDAMPKRAYLSKGAKYRYLGSSNQPTLSRPDKSAHADHPNAPALVLSPDTSSLYAALCDPDPRMPDGPCRFRSTVVLTKNIDCDGLCSPTGSGGDGARCECSVDAPRVVRVDPSPQTGGSRVYFEYVRPPCVQLAFPSDDARAVSEIGGSEALAICAEVSLPVAGTSCCDEGGGGTAESVCVFISERVSFETANDRCKAIGKSTCSWQSLLPSASCGTFHAPVMRKHKQGLQFHWTNSTCKYKVQVDHEGNVGIVHDIGELNRQVAGRVSAPGATYFRVSWDGSDGSFPNVSDGCSTGGSFLSCVVRGSACICDANVVNRQVFTKSSLPNRLSIIQKLHIGAPDPFSFGDGTYHECASPVCVRLKENQGISIHTRTVGQVTEDVNLSVDESTVFEIRHDGEQIFLSNTKSTVKVGGGQWSFRNPPMYGNFIDESERDSLYETDAILNHYLQHPNVPPFIANRLIQLLITSNPSPHYIQTVARAFKSGNYTSESGQIFGVGQFGDLHAVTAAIYLDAEARSSVLDADGIHGRAREPLLKVMHFLRAMEMESNEAHEVNLFRMRDKIGQESHYSPSVFSFFLPDYQPVGPILDKGLVSPESQLLNPLQLISFINGVTSLPKYGLVDCAGGFGQSSERKIGKNLNCLILDDGNSSTEKVPFQLRWMPSHWNATSIVQQLDMLLTGGKLSKNNREIIEAAYNEALSSSGKALEALNVAQSMVAIAPEFHVTNTLVKNEAPAKLREKAPVKHSSQSTATPIDDYKAVVYVFLAGGMDSYNVLVPMECTPSDLFSQYNSIRSNVAIGRNSLRQIAASGNQPCSTFGVHPSLSAISDMYDGGDAVLLANVGPLVAPVTKEDFENGTKGIIPPALFSHNTQQRAAQTLHAQNPHANGILGRIGDTLNLQASLEKGQNVEIFSAYSTFGSPKAMEGVPGVSRAADVLSGRGIVDLLDVAKKMEDNIINLQAQKASSIYGETYSDRVSSSLDRVEYLIGALSQKELVRGPWYPACCKGSICTQLQQVAQLINNRDHLEGSRSAFYAKDNGYDTHDNNGPHLTLKLRELDEALACFANEMKAQGIWKNVTVLVASDFGRTLTSNGLGTDHGWGGNYIALGGAVRGRQVLGEYPNDLSETSPLNIGRGRIIPTTSWDCVWNAVAQWMGVHPRNINEVLPNLYRFPQKRIISKNEMFV